VSPLAPSERVAELLLAAGYRRVPAPLEVAGLKFEVAGAFVGGDRAADLVIVADMAAEGERQVVQQIDGIARALDVMRSRRPLTSVIVGPRPVGKSLDALAQVGRMLAVEEASDPVDLRDRLAVLLPLEVPQTSDGDNDLVEDDDFVVPDSEVARRLFEAAGSGEDAVRQTFYDAVTSILADGSDDIEDILG